MLNRSKAIAGAAVLASLIGCAADGTTDGAGGGKADHLGETMEIVIAQAGAFNEFDELEAELIHYGFTDERAPGWEAAGDISISYDENHESEPVVLSVPIGQPEDYLAFVIMGVDRSTTIWNSDQFIDLNDPDGRMVEMPIRNGAGYPFSPECFDITVKDLNSPSGSSSFAGKVSYIFYGFTTASAEDYIANNNVPWFNADLSPKAEGIIHPVIRHDGGFKGSYRMLENWIRVPAGMNLVFKPAIEIFNGSCVNDGDTSFREFTETKTYFAE
jgi:hypothetical protein